MVVRQDTRKQQLLTQKSAEPKPTTSKKSEFNMDLFQAFLTANIRIAKLKNKSLRGFLEKLQPISYRMNRLY